MKYNKKQLYNYDMHFKALKSIRYYLQKYGNMPGLHVDSVQDIIELFETGNPYIADQEVNETWDALNMCKLTKKEKK